MKLDKLVADRQTAVTIKTALCVLVITLNCWLPNLSAQTTKNESTLETERTTLQTPQDNLRPRQRMNFVKVVDFYLRDGKLIFGKLVSEGKNKLTVEHLEGSKIIVSTYSKREIDTRTLHTENVLESRYFLERAEYFLGRTWDFIDDPDDFIQAMRCYEKAKQSLAATQTRDMEKISQIDDKIKQLQADKQVWIRETESRAELKKLEFIATIEKRIKVLEDKVNENSRQVNAATEQLDNIAAGIENNNQKLQDSIVKIQNDMTQQTKMLQDRIENNRQLLYRYQWYPRFRYIPPATQP